MKVRSKDSRIEMNIRRLNTYNKVKEEYKGSKSTDKLDYSEMLRRHILIRNKVRSDRSHVLNVNQS